MTFYHNISPSMFQIGNLEVRWYGSFYIIGFFLAYLFVKKNFKYRDVQIKREIYDTLLFNIMIGLVFGARLGYIVFYNLGYYFMNPLEVFAFWQGGLSFHGGAIGVIIAGYLTLRKKQIDFFKTADPFMPFIALGLGLGRLGNFINGELVGRPTNSDWGVIFPEAVYYLDGGKEILRHPSQLYQAFTEGLLLFVILQIMLKKTKSNGIVFWSFFVFYSFFRIATEFFREPDSHIGFIAGYFTMGQILSFVILIVAATFIYLNYIREKRNEKK